MKRFSLMLLVAVLSTLLVATVVSAAPADIESFDSAPGCATRPLSDFLDAQGSTEFFFPPVKDMLGWTDAEFTTFAIVDYAGLADQYIVSETGASLGTDFSGRVLECPTGDGGAEISVVLNTRHALGFAQSVEAIIENGFDFLNTPTIFGVKAQDVVAGADAAVGPASLQLTFHIAEVGGDLPDMRIALQEQVSTYAPISLNFRSTTIGTLPDGTNARLRVQQVGAAAVGDEELTFSREIVDLNK